MLVRGCRKHIRHNFSTMSQARRSAALSADAAFADFKLHEHFVLESSCNQNIIAQ